MKFIINRVIVAFLLVTLAGVAAFAKNKRAHVTFTEATSVNGTIVKQGTYEVVYNEETGELSILKDDKVVAKAATRLEMLGRKANNTEVHTRHVDMGVELVGVTFVGSDQHVLVKQAGMQAGGN